MNKPENWFAFMLILVVFIIACLLVDALLVGLLWLVLTVLQVTKAFFIAKLVFFGIFVMQLIAVIPLTVGIVGGKFNGT